MTRRSERAPDRPPRAAPAGATSAGAAPAGATSAGATSAGAEQAGAEQAGAEQAGAEQATGRLVLAATPIGDLGDASPRLGQELATADVIAAEDTRRLRRLLAALGVTTSARVISYFDGNEATRTPGLVAALRAGERVVLVTDAGMPAVSDPGYRLVRAAVDAGIPVSAVPGPSAVLTALAVSGLPVDRFCFEGFLPRKAGERATALRALATEPRTMVFFEAPHRLAGTLAALAEAFGAERSAAVCRELTKTYEEVRRGELAALADWAGSGVRGEITIVVAGRPMAAAADADPGRLRALVAERQAGGQSRKDAIAAVAAQVGQPKRIVYNAVVAAKRGADPA